MAKPSVSTGKTALIAGASGLVGRDCLRRLLRCQRYESVISFGRKTLELEHPKLRQIVVGFDRLQAHGPSLEIDDVFCCLGTTIRRAGSPEAFRRVDLEFPLQLARFGLAHRASRFLIVSSIGASPTSRNFYLKTKGELEAALDALRYEALVIVRPSVLLGHRREIRFAELIGKLLLTGVSPLLLGRLRKYTPIPAGDVAACLVAMAGKVSSGTFVLESDRIRQEADLVSET